MTPDMNNLCLVCFVMTLKCPDTDEYDCAISYKNVSSSSVNLLVKQSLCCVIVPYDDEKTIPELNTVVANRMGA